MRTYRTSLHYILWAALTALLLMFVAQTVLFFRGRTESDADVVNPAEIVTTAAEDDQSSPISRQRLEEIVREAGSRLKQIVATPKASLTVEEEARAWATRQLDFFKRRLTERELAESTDLMRVLTSILDAADIPYFLAFGTLLGSYRNHGSIPWDDDVDLALPYRHERRIQAVLVRFSELYPKYTIHYNRKKAHGERDKVMKFFHSDGREIGTYWKWKWPFIDIFLYHKSARHVWFYNWPEDKYEADDVFPLLTRPYDGLLLKAPRQPTKLLEAVYGRRFATKCKPTTWVHKFETQDYQLDENVKTTQCELVYRYHNYTHVTSRGDDDSGRTEVLSAGGKNVSVYRVDLTSGQAEIVKL